MSKKFIKWFVTSSVILIYYSFAMAYKPVVHERITDEAIQHNLTNINGKIRDYLGLDSVEDVINNKMIKRWIKDGSFKEDYNWGWNNNPLFSHFYNPITNDSGVGGIWPSAYDWANATNNDWSWKKTRDYFYQGLTFTTKTQREEALAKAFKGIGHIIHLVEDVSVPAHTRADLHIPVLDNEPYESYTNIKIGSLQYTSVPFPYWNISNGAAAPRQLWDVDSYDGTPYSGEYIGLAEYTNENYFSKNTIFNSFPYPDWPSIVEYTDIDINGKKRIYLKKLGYAEGGYGESINHLAAGKWYYKYLPSWLKRNGLELDDKCHEDYQQKLIPRAVGYSAGLLDYFFRGTLEITVPEQVAYAVTDGSNTPYVDAYGHYHQQFRSIKAKIRNSTPDTIPTEEMQNGILQAVVKYKIIPNYMYDLSNYPPDGTVMHDIPFSYSVSDPITITSLSSTEPTEFTFNFFSSPVPAGITDLHLFIVFKGTLGNETDIAIAVGKKDLMEPTHQVLWNLTDMFSLDNHLYTSDTIKTTPALAAMVDLDHDGVFNETGEPYIDPHPVTFGIGYLKNPPGQSNPFTYSAITEVQPGRHIRLVVLVDKPQENYLVLEESDVVMGTSYYYFAPPGVVNQEEDGIWQTPTPMITFRYGLDIDGITQIPIRQHFYTGVLKCYPVGTDPYGNPACGYPEQEAIPAELLPSPIDAVYFP